MGPLQLGRSGQEGMGHKGGRLLGGRIRATCQSNHILSVGFDAHLVTNPGDMGASHTQIFPLHGHYSMAHVNLSAGCFPWGISLGEGSPSGRQALEQGLADLSVKGQGWHY